MDDRLPEKLPEALRGRLRSFVPAATEIPAAEAGEIPGLPETVAYWTGEDRPAAEWFREVEEHWGSPGLVMRRGPEVLGYAVYAPVEYLPRALCCPAGPVSRDAVLLAYAAGDARTRRHLLVRALREMRLRGTGRAEAIGNDAGIAKHHLATRHLVESGWEPVGRGCHKGLYYTLTRVELGNTVEVGELARGLIGRVKIPSFGRTPAPAPGAAPGTAGSSFNRSRTSPHPPRKERPPERAPSPV